MTRYPWWDRWQSLRGRSLPQADAERAMSIAADFIAGHDLEAERCGWQPVHIMRPASGLAWRWPHFSEPLFRPKLMAVRFGMFDIIYRAERCGNIHIVKGDARHKALMLFGLPGEYSQ